MISEAIPIAPTWPHATEIDAATHCINFGAGSHDACRLYLPKTSQNHSRCLPKDEVDLVLPNSGSHAWAPQVIRSQDKGRKEGRFVHANGTTDQEDAKSRKQKAVERPQGQSMSHQAARRVGGEPTHHLLH